MTEPSTFIAILKKHKRWADTASVASIVLVVGLSCLVEYISETTQADATTKIGMYIAMVGIVIVVCIWQAAAFAVATIESALLHRDTQKPYE